MTQVIFFGFTSAICFIHATCKGETLIFTGVSGRLGKSFRYLYSTKSTPAGPTYIASGTPPANLSWIFQLNRLSGR